MTGDLSSSYPVLAAALVLLGAGGLAFRQAYAWIRAEAEKQRVEREKEIAAQRAELVAALEAQKQELSGQFNARILSLETHIKVLEGRIAEDERIRKIVVAECAKGLMLDASPEVRACFQKILEAVG